MKRLISALFAFCLAGPFAGPVSAHPHIFIDTGFEFRFDAQGRLSQVKVIWAYDEFYSLLITEDLALDADFDGVLTKGEQARLTGFDMNWDEGFNGDLVILQGDAPVSLSGPTQATAALQHGRIVTTHVRNVSKDQQRDTAFQVKPYDKTYYSAYDVTLPIRFAGAEGCGFSLDEPELDAALMSMRAELQALDADVTFADTDLPDVGGALASTVVVTCDMS